MLARYLSAIIGIPIFIGVTVWGRLPFGIAVLILAVLGTIEMVRTYWRQGIHANPILAGLGILGPAWAIAPSRLTGGLFLILLVAGLFLGLNWELLRRESQAVRNTLYGILSGLYISLFGWLGLLRAWSEPATRISALEPGAAILLLTVFCVWATDSVAFFVGRAWGKRKLAPTISPGKTLEGAVGGLCGGLAAGALFGWLFFDSASLGLTVGAIAGIFGQIGDLFESALKRDVGVKDFGGIMPGHGGILDRFDSLLLAAPITALSLWIRGGI